MAKLRRDTIPDEDYGPQDAGWDARLEGRHESDNPYPVTNWKYYDWQQGWRAADESVAGADPAEPAAEG